MFGGLVLLVPSVIRIPSQVSISYFLIILMTCLLIIFGLAAFILIIDSNIEQNVSFTTDYEPLSGLAKRSPVLSFLLTFLLLSICGLPLTSGFNLLVILCKTLLMSENILAVILFSASYVVLSFVIFKLSKPLI